MPAPAVTATQSTLQSGRADGVRRFRPDIEGLRTIAVGLVLVFHAYGTPFSGGFVGVDVFFVISGFLITDILMREHSKTGRVSILGFYARRARRILPASALVVVATVAASYYLLGFLTGNDVAIAAKWTAVFAANIHFGFVGTDYFGSQLPPSPLLHMWSLGCGGTVLPGLARPVSTLMLSCAAPATGARRDVADRHHRGVVRLVRLSDRGGSHLGVLLSLYSRRRTWSRGLDRGAGTGHQPEVETAMGRRGTRIVRVGRYRRQRAAAEFLDAISRGGDRVAGHQHRTSDCRRLHRYQNIRGAVFVASADAVVGRAVVLAIPVALADPDHRQPVFGAPSERMAVDRPVAADNSGVHAQLPTGGEPGSPRPIADCKTGTEPCGRRCTDCCHHRGSAGVHRPRRGHAQRIRTCSGHNHFVPIAGLPGHRGPGAGGSENRHDSPGPHPEPR